MFEGKNEVIWNVNLFLFTYNYNLNLLTNINWKQMKVFVRFNCRTIKSFLQYENHPHWLVENCGKLFISIIISHALFLWCWSSVRWSLLFNLSELNFSKSSRAEISPWISVSMQIYFSKLFIHLFSLLFAFTINRRSKMNSDA